ncbi:hypothetical protein L9F63_014694, partial [Diploptera punctata]
VEFFLRTKEREPQGVSWSKRTPAPYNRVRNAILVATGLRKTDAIFAAIVENTLQCHIHSGNPEESSKDLKPVIEKIQSHFRNQRIIS